MKKLYTKCPVEYTVSIISDKWKVLIIRDLLEKEKRYSELMKSVVGISDKVLAKNLRELEQDGIINRKVYAVVPPNNVSKMYKRLYKKYKYCHWL